MTYNCTIWTPVNHHLLLLVTVVIVRFVPSVQSSERCDVSSVLVPDANVMGGKQNMAGSNVTECEIVCAEMTSCVGFDWNRKDSECFLLTSSDESINYNFSGVDHFNLLRDTDNCIGACSYPRWVPIVNSHCFGARALEPRAGLIDCARHCLENVSCSAFDWDPLNPDGHRCWIVSAPCPAPYPSPGVFHYAKTCTPVSTTIDRTSAASVTTLPSSSAQTLLPSTHLPYHSTVTSLPTTHPSSSSTTTTTTTTTVTLSLSTLPKSSLSSTTTITRLPSTSTKTSTSSSTGTTSATSKATFPVGVSVASLSSTETSTTSSSFSIRTTTTEFALSTTRARDVFPTTSEGSKSTVASGVAGVTSSTSNRNIDATTSAAPVTSLDVLYTATNITNSTTPTWTTPTWTTPTRSAPNGNADPSDVISQDQQEYEYGANPLAIKPTYIILAGVGGGCLLLVLTAVVILCQYPLGGEEDARIYKPYNVHSTLSSSNEIVDMDFFDVEHNPPEFRTSGVVAPEFEASSLN